VADGKHRKLVRLDDLDQGRREAGRILLADFADGRYGQPFDLPHAGRPYHTTLLHRRLQIFRAQPSAGFCHVGDILEDYHFILVVGASCLFGTC
jgi:hypothetical protein